MDTAGLDAGSCPLDATGFNAGPRPLDAAADFRGGFVLPAISHFFFPCDFPLWCFEDFLVFFVFEQPVTPIFVLS